MGGFVIQSLCGWVKLRWEEPSCGWICNPAIVWLGEVAVGKFLDRIEKSTRCPRFDPVFGSNNHPLFGPLSIMIITEHSIVVGVTTVVCHLGRQGGNTDFNRLS